MKNERDISAVMKALKKYDINNEEELYRTLKNLKPINISCMVSPIKTDKSKELRGGLND